MAILARFPRVDTIPILPSLPPWLPFTQGRIWHVCPSSGSDSNSGKSPRAPFKTLAAALAAATANQNDIVLMYSESNTGSSTTDYQSAQLDWNKDLVHLIGVNSGVSMSPRSRIAAISTYTDAAPIVKVSADGCYIANLQIYMGVADTNPLGALSVTGSRNRFDNCHILGMGASTNDVAGAYSLLLSGAEECEFHGCTIGSDRTILGAAANSQILCAAFATNNRFFGCEVKVWSAHGTNTLFLRAAAGSLYGVLRFHDCAFINSAHLTGSSALTYGFAVASATGDVVLSGTTGVMATDVNATDNGNVYGVGAVATAATFGVGNALTK